MRYLLALAAIATALAVCPPNSAAQKKSPAKAQAPTSAADVFSSLASIPGMRAEFREEKYIAVLVDPVVSEGLIFLAPPSKLIRVTTAPIWSSLVVDDKSIAYRDTAGPKKIPAAKGDPARRFVEVFVDVARGNHTKLKKTFAIKFAKVTPKSQKGAAGWKVTLTPKRKGLGIVRIELAGQTSRLASMTIHDTNGDRTELVFTKLVGKRPSDKEIARALKAPKAR